MLRAKGLPRAHLVSDATAVAGLAPGRYESPVGGEVELAADGRLSQRTTGRLAGAARSLADGVATAAVMARLSLADALSLATTNPGRIVGDRGSLRPGSSADILTFDWAPGDRELTIKSVIAAGHPATATGSTQGQDGSHGIQTAWQ
jgi:N-acetylglucosamine-6-phosphate deacetylase